MTKIKKEATNVANKEELFKLLKSRIPGLFDREPNGAISNQALEKLVEDIINL